MTQEKYRDAVQSCGDEVRKAKANLVLNLTKATKRILQVYNIQICNFIKIIGNNWNVGGKKPLTTI